MGPAVAGCWPRGEQSHMADRITEQAAAVIARQLADAQATAERLRRQALEAGMEVQAEMEAEWIQAEEAEEAAERAEREAQFEQLAAEQAAEDAAALPLLLLRSVKQQHAPSGKKRSVRQPNGRKPWRQSQQLRGCGAAG